jgi:quinol monooxygenase YgiN
MPEQRGQSMINVIASIRVRAGARDQFLEMFKANVPTVRGEDGCIEYVPTLDIDVGLPGQELDENVVTVVEKWRDIASLRAHLRSSHMQLYAGRTRALVESRLFKVLQEA